MNYAELSLPERQREEIHRILSDASDRAGGIDNESILRSLQELTTDDTGIQACFADLVIPLLEAAIDAPNPEAALSSFSLVSRSSIRALVRRISALISVSVTPSK